MIVRVVSNYILDHINFQVNTHVSKSVQKLFYKKNSCPLWFLLLMLCDDDICVMFLINYSVNVVRTRLRHQIGT